MVARAGSRSKSSEGGIAEIAIIAILALAVVGVAATAVLIGAPASHVEPQVPVFTASPDPAQLAADRYAQSSARNTVAAALTAYTDHETFRGVTVKELRQIEPSLAFTSDASLNPTEPSVAFTPSAVGIAVRSGAGSCFWLRVSSGGSTTYDEGEPCTGRAALGASAPSWS